LAVLRSFRRYFLDRLLLQHQYLFTGHVLDVGGKKTEKRGLFSPPVDQVKDWKYLNTDACTNPDYCAPVEEIPLSDHSVDTVLMTEVLEYISERDLALKEICRVLTPGGGLILTIPFLHPIHGDFQDDRVRYTPVALLETLEKCGFSAEKIDPMGSVGSVIYDIFRTSFGYASKGVVSSIFGKVLPLFWPFFYLLDMMTQRQRQFINTGYFIVARKK